MAAEFVSRLSKEFERSALPALALTTDTSFLTAFANDCGYEGVFERQVEAFGQERGLLIGISTSGNSQNVIRAVEPAKALKMRTIALTGNGGKLTSMVDIAISVPNGDTKYIQETHLAIENNRTYIMPVGGSDTFPQSGGHGGQERLKIGYSL